ncbi:hypothetical protein WG908_10215 [Sphingobium sp. AN641]|uniref:hypothetical protein n=1 Tax=Sphingobium sp. AN641 TaxID=3133443 RepID=UPI0030BD5163
MTPNELKADLPLAQRKHIEAERQQEIRAALVRRHVEVLDEQHAIEAAQSALPVHSPEYRAMAERIRT